MLKIFLKNKFFDGDKIHYLAPLRTGYLTRWTLCGDYVHISEPEYRQGITKKRINCKECISIKDYVRRDSIKSFNKNSKMSDLQGILKKKFVCDCQACKYPGNGKTF